MLTIEQTYIIYAPPEQVWAALTDPILQAQWTGQPAAYDARMGGAYKLWDDYVSGEVVEFDPPNKLAQTWKPGDWTIDNSVVSFTLTPVPEGTRLDLLHINVEPTDYKGTMEGWQTVYVGAIKDMLEGDDEPMQEIVTKKAPAKKAAAKKAIKKAAKKAAKKKVVARKAVAKKKTSKGKK